MAFLNYYPILLASFIFIAVASTLRLLSRGQFPIWSLLPKERHLPPNKSRYCLVWVVHTYLYVLNDYLDSINSPFEQPGPTY